MGTEARGTIDDTAGGTIPPGTPDTADETPDAALGYEAADIRWLAPSAGEEPPADRRQGWRR